MIIHGGSDLTDLIINEKSSWRDSDKNVLYSCSSNQCAVAPQTQTDSTRIKAPWLFL